MVVASDITVQRQCPFRSVEHVGIVFDTAVYNGVVDALRYEPIRLSC
jgi:hypothetical protein